jgi:hypothetical protein
MYLDRISRQAWLPLGAALIFAISAGGSYSSIATAADIKVTLADDPGSASGQEFGDRYRTDHRR